MVSPELDVHTNVKQARIPSILSVYQVKPACRTQYQTGIKPTPPKEGSRIMPSSSLQIYLRPGMTLTFDLLGPRVDHFMPLPTGRRVPIGIRIGLCSKCCVCKFGKRKDAGMGLLRTRQSRLMEGQTHRGSSCWQMVAISQSCVILQSPASESILNHLHPSGLDKVQNVLTRLGFL